MYFNQLYLWVACSLQFGACLASQAPLADTQASWATSRTSELLSLHKSLIEIESITGNESSVGHWLKGYLESKNFTVELQEVTKNRYNVFAYPKERKTKVLVTSHIDTVPPFWPYEIKDNSTIWGRGSVDAKASVAAQIIAVQSILSKHSLPGDSLALLYVIGEEVGGDGMKYFSKHKPGEYDAVIFGEPTERKLASGHKGILSLTINAKGKAGHSGYPWLALSANSLLIEALSTILKLEPSLPHSEKYGSTTVNVGKISGGVAANVIAETASASIAIRLAAGEPIDTKKAILNALQPIIEKASDGDGKLEVVWGNEGYGPIDIDHDIKGFDVLTFSYGTDVPHLKGTHRRYLYGPGTILVAHSDHENIEISDLEAAVDGYEKIILAVLEK